MSTFIYYLSWVVLGYCAMGLFYQWDDHRKAIKRLREPVKLYDRDCLAVTLDYFIGQLNLSTGTYYASSYVELHNRCLYNPSFLGN
jgi:hypothetical protein